MSWWQEFTSVLSSISVNINLILSANYLFNKTNTYNQMSMLQNFRKAYLPYNHFFWHNTALVSFLYDQVVGLFRTSTMYYPTSRSSDEQYYILEVVKQTRYDLTWKKYAFEGKTIKYLF